MRRLINYQLYDMSEMNTVLISKMTGLESLKIKETDRIEAMQRELLKFGCALEENQDHWSLIPGESRDGEITVETYEDHRMAMAFAPMCMVSDLVIKEPDVVRKSYPGFWEDLKTVGIEIKSLND